MTLCMPHNNAKGTNIFLKGSGEWNGGQMPNQEEIFVSEKPNIKNGRKFTEILTKQQ